MRIRERLLNSLVSVSEHIFPGRALKKENFVVEKVTKQNTLLGIRMSVADLSNAAEDSLPEPSRAHDTLRCFMVGCVAQGIDIPAPAERERERKSFKLTDDTKPFDGFYCMDGETPQIRIAALEKHGVVKSIGFILNPAVAGFWIGDLTEALSQMVDKVCDGIGQLQARRGGAHAIA